MEATDQLTKGFHMRLLLTFTTYYDPCSHFTDVKTEAQSDSLCLFKFKAHPEGDLLSPNLVCALCLSKMHTFGQKPEQIIPTWTLFTLGRAIK